MFSSVLISVCELAWISRHAERESIALDLASTKVTSSSWVKASSVHIDKVCATLSDNIFDMHTLYIKLY